MLKILLFFIAGLAVCRIIARPVMQLISRAAFTRENYQGRSVPVGIGIVLLLGSMAVLAPLYFTLSAGIKFRTLIFLLTLSGFTFLGLADDFWGDRSNKGLSGHLTLLLKGCLTTGALKAIFGLLLCLLLAQASGHIKMVPLNTALMALSVNTVNLLDLRPGRAAKFFLSMSAVLAVIYRGSSEIIFLLLVMGCLAAILPLDIKARAMLGDAGANALGAVLGLFAMWLLSPTEKIIILLLLATLHLYAEKHSITAAIEKYKLLNFLDKLGRG